MYAQGRVCPRKEDESARLAQVAPTLLHLPSVSYVGNKDSHVTGESEAPGDSQKPALTASPQQVSAPFFMGSERGFRATDD